MQNKNFVILGIDPGIADTGYGIICTNNDKFICLTYGSIKTSAKLPLADRLQIISEELYELIKRYKPQLIAVEQLFFCTNVKTAIMVGEARGVVLLTAKQYNVAITEYTPLQVKQAVSAYGKASKLQVQKMVKLLLNLNELPKPDDAADALAVAICAANSLSNNKSN
jgi:crossover junction endodeoxyribonuclease RuvC